MNAGTAHAPKIFIPFVINKMPKGAYPTGLHPLAATFTGS
jgi:hypothetical protein